MLLWLTLQYHINPFAFYSGGKAEREISVDNEKLGWKSNFGSNSLSVQQLLLGRTRNFHLSVKTIRPISKAFVCDNVQYYNIIIITNYNVLTGRMPPVTTHDLTSR